jgi:hypothetical protein
MRFYALLSGLLLSCATTTHDEAPPEKATDPTLPAPLPAPPPPAAPIPPPAPPPPPAKDCSLPSVTGAPEVPATFIVGAPPAMTGGALAGDYAVEHATVYLPTAAAGLVDPKNSTGTVTAWATFQGARYRLSLTSSFTIASVAGPQTSGVDTQSQGGFVAKGAAITLDHECDTAIADEADYSFTDDGSGFATILIKTPTAYGDVYLALEAIK